MDTTSPLRPPRRPLPRLLVTAAALACLAIAYGLARALDPVVDLANLAMVFVLASTLVAFWLPVWASALFTVAGVGLLQLGLRAAAGQFQRRRATRTCCCSARCWACRCRSGC